MGSFRTFQKCGVIAFLLLATTKASIVKFQAYPGTVKANLTSSVSMRCSLADTEIHSNQIGKRSVTSTDTDIRHVSAIRIIRNADEDVASVTPFDAPEALADLGNLEVKGDVSGRSSEGYIELTWKDPSTMAKGEYTCEVSTTTARHQTVVFSEPLEMLEVAPTMDDVIEEFKGLLKKQQDQLNGQDKKMASLEQRLDQLHDCTVHRVGFMAAISNSRLNGNHLDIAKDQPIVFDKTIYSSMGGAYDNQTGLFTCMDPGLYHFNVHAVGKHTNDIDLDLMLNSQVITSFYALDTVTVGSGSASAVLHLKTNDVVHVVTAYHTAELFADINVVQSNVFMGHMVHSDACLV